VEFGCLPLSQDCHAEGRGATLKPPHTVEVEAAFVPLAARTALINAADGWAVLLAQVSGAVVVQDFGGEASGLLQGGSDDHDRAALLYMRGIEFLFADVIWLFAGEAAHFGFFEGTASAK